MRREGSAILVHSAEIERSGRYGFYDDPYVEAVYLSQYKCPEVVRSDPLLSGNEESRGTVNYYVNPDLVGCPLPMPGRAVPLIQKNEFCGTTIVEGEFSVLEVDWEPKCLVVVIAPDSRKILFEEMTVCCGPMRFASLLSRTVVFAPV